MFHTVSSKQYILLYSVTQPCLVYNVRCPKTVFKPSKGVYFFGEGMILEKIYAPNTQHMRQSLVKKQTKKNRIIFRIIFLCAFKTKKNSALFPTENFFFYFAGQWRSVYKIKINVIFF